VTDKITHKAKHMTEAGDVSPLCRAKRPRPIDLTVETWTLLDAQVTCSKCLKALASARKP